MLFEGAVAPETDTTPPTISSIDDGDVDDVVVAGSILSYTIAFNEDIDSATVTAGDFNNAGSSAITIGAINESSPGIFSVQVTADSAGTVSLRIPTGAEIQDTAGNTLVVPVIDDTTVTVTSSDVTPPTLLSIADNDTDNLLAVGGTVTYSLTFSEDIDELTVGAIDFDNAGSAGISIGTITETAPGVISVPVTATSAGSLQLRIPLLADIRDLAGNPLVGPRVRYQCFYR